ncbi:hypothetical protein PIB30_044984, partial [Stylosanthes scabra]|nr:hypothetical protein [Stylosanthes scabra]
RWAIECWAGSIERRVRYVYLREFGPSGPNIRNSCPELRKADVTDVPGFMSCQACPECRVVVRPLGLRAYSRSF